MLHSALYACVERVQIIAAKSINSSHFHNVPDVVKNSLPRDRVISLCSCSHSSSEQTIQDMYKDKRIEKINSFTYVTGPAKTGHVGTNYTP